jgi:hypothetical protein
MDLERDECNKNLGDGRQVGGIEGCLIVEGPQRVMDAAETSKIFDGLESVLLDGPQRGKGNKRQAVDK